MDTLMQEWQEKIEQEVTQLKQEVRQLREQRTEEMKAINVNVASADVLNQLKVLEQGQKDLKADVDELKIDAKAYTGDAAIFKNKVERVESDVSTIKSDVEQVKTIQSGHSKFFEAHGKRLDQMATKEDISRLESMIQKLIDKGGS